MDSDKYLEGQSMQRPPLFESDCFIYWKNRFETYVKAKDLDLWHIILNGDFPPVARNKDTQVLEVVPFEEQSDDLKKKLAKNNEAKMVLYNALPKKEYERVFMCKTAKDIWQSLLITHQGNSQRFARFNTIITSLKALDEGFSSKNYVRKFLRALHPKWRAKVTTIEESKDLSSLALDELIGNLKVHEVVMEKDSEIYRGKKERVKSIALKAKKESSDDETSTSGSDDEEYAMAGCDERSVIGNALDCGDPNHLFGDCPKPPRNKDQKAFIGGSWSDSENDFEDKTNDETCQGSIIKLGLGFDSSKASTSGTKPINFVGLSAEIAPDGSTIKAHGSTIPGFVDPSSSEKETEHVFCPPMSSRSDFVITRKKLIHNKIEESKKPSLKPSLKSGLGYVKPSLAIENNTKVVNNSNKEDESIEVDEVVNIKESKNHPLEQVIEPKNVNEALGDESWVIAIKTSLHEGRFITPSFIEENNMLPSFQAVGLEPFLTLDEPICPRSVAEFYHSLEVKRDEE
ncbi:hypothetical protein Tco_0826001, partial [Tanacetum coccineum]